MFCSSLQLALILSVCHKWLKQAEKGDMEVADRTCFIPSNTATISFLKRGNNVIPSVHNCSSVLNWLVQLQKSGTLGESPALSFSLKKTKPLLRILAVQGKLCGD